MVRSLRALIVSAAAMQAVHGVRTPSKSNIYQIQQAPPPTPAPDHLPGCTGPLLYGVAIAIEYQAPDDPKYVLERMYVPNVTTNFSRIDGGWAVFKLKPNHLSGVNSAYVNYGDEVIIENQRDDELMSKQLLQRAGIDETVKRNETVSFTNDTGRIRSGGAVWKIHSYPANQSGKVDCNSEVRLENQLPPGSADWLSPRWLQSWNYHYDPRLTHLPFDGTRWKFRPVCGAMHAGGNWKPKQFFQKAAGVTTGIHIGVMNLSSITEAESWQTSLSASVTAGYDASVLGSGPHGSVTVSGSYARSGSEAATRAFQQDWSKTLTIAPAVSGQLWQFSFDAESPCGNSAVDTDDYVITAGLWATPCCPPGWFADPDTIVGPCAERSLCMCDDATCSR